MRLIALVSLIAAAGLTVFLAVDFGAVMHWAAAQQRGFQDQMAGAVHALRAGQPGAIAALLAAAAAYGFVHAVGPGHGKYVIGSVGLGTSVSMGRLLGLAVASSLAQALWAIVLVYGGFSILTVSARQMTALAEDFLAPVSYIAITLVGLVLVWRGVRALAQRAAEDSDRMNHSHHGHHHQHQHGECGCGHAHGPSVEQAAQVGSVREALVLIASIAVRPCTGAIFLLVIAWSMDIRLAGAAAVVVMGLGTAALTSLVAVSGVAARGMTFAAVGGEGVVSVAVPAVQVLPGAVIVWISLVLLSYAVI